VTQRLQALPEHGGSPLAHAAVADLRFGSVWAAAGTGSVVRIR
jgi:hypothetical protein